MFARLVATGLVFFGILVGVIAQENDTNANISHPRPVSVLSGQVSVLGTADLPGMRSFYLEYRPLNDDLSPAGTGSWHLQL